MNLNRVIIFLLILFIALFAMYFPSRTSSGAIIERTRLYMGTIIQIKVPVGAEDDKEGIKQAIDRALEEIGRIEAVFSVFNKDSEIAKINRLKQAEALMISDEVFRVIEKSVEYNKITDGAFDITVKPLVDLWAQAKEAKRLPSDLAVRDALDKTGSQFIVLDNVNKTIAFKKDGMALDMGGLAKGYATDRAIEVLKENGVLNAIVSSGGDMYCLGRRSRDKLWEVGIRHPRKKGQIILQVGVEDKAVDTSGDYEKYFISNGRRYSHIIDPRTGYPIGDGVVSATVFANDSMTADILATALTILGEDGMEMIKSVNGAGAIVISKKKDNTLGIEMSEGLDKEYVITGNQRQ